MIAPLWTAEEAAAAVGGTAYGEWEAYGVSIDTRSMRRGDLFVALPGTTRDGHEFVLSALEKGAGAVLIDHPVEGLVDDAPILMCADVMSGLEALGRAARARSRARVIGVTGSVGKTSTKEALKAALSRFGSTHASARSFNNHIGVPLTLARLRPDTEFAVLEMGMNHAGELAELSALAQPDIAVITNVEGVHTEFFDSVADIADAKAEIFTGLRPGGVAVLSRDNPYFDRLALAASNAGVGRVVSFGAASDADVRLLKQRLHEDCSTVTADVSGQPMMFKVGVPGAHWVMNSLTVLATVLVADADLGLAGLALQEIMAPEGRGRRHLIPFRDSAILVIDESYNASPASVRAALSGLAGAKSTLEGRSSPIRRIAVLGDMRELGDDAVAQHEALAPIITKAAIDLVYTVGEDMRHLHDALPRHLRAGHADTAAHAEAELLKLIMPNDVIMLKASNTVGLSLVVQGLLQLDVEPAASAVGR